MTQDWDRWEEAAIEQIARGVRSSRELRGMSQQALATAAGIARSQVANLETAGRVRALPSVGVLVRLAYALNIPPVTLIYPALPDGAAEVWPGVTTDSTTAAEWFSGVIPAWQVREAAGEYVPRRERDESGLERIEAAREYDRLKTFIGNGYRRLAAGEMGQRRPRSSAHGDEAGHPYQEQAIRGEIARATSELDNLKTHMRDQGWPVIDEPLDDE